MRGNFPGNAHLKHLTANRHAVLITVLSVATPVSLWASHPSSLEEGTVFKVQMSGSRLNVYGEQLLSDPDYKIFFGAEEADYLFEPRLIDVNDSRVQLMLPFQPIAGRYRFKIGATENEPVIDLVLVVDDSRILIDHTTTGNAHALLKVTNCDQEQSDCVSEASNQSAAFCGMSADFDPYQGSQAITVSKTQELHLDDYYTIEARVFLRDYVRGGIIVDKYSGSGRGREYRLSVGKRWPVTRLVFCRWNTGKLEGSVFGLPSTQKSMGSRRLNQRRRTHALVHRWPAGGRKTIQRPPCPVGVPEYCNWR